MYSFNDNGMVVNISQKIVNQREVEIGTASTGGPYLNRMDINLSHMGSRIHTHFAVQPASQPIFLNFQIITRL